MGQGSRTVWADPQDVAGDGKRVHVYRVVDGRAIRRCGQDKHAPKTTDPLRRITVDQWLRENNYCRKCRNHMGLGDYQPSSNGAESVDADPFGVFEDPGDAGADPSDNPERDTKESTTGDTKDDADTVHDGQDDGPRWVSGDITWDAGSVPDVEDRLEEAIDRDDDDLDIQFSADFDLDDFSDADLLAFLEAYTAMPRDLAEYLLERIPDGERPQPVSASPGPKDGTLKHAVWQAVPGEWTTGKDIHDRIPDGERTSVNSTYATVSALVDDGHVERRQMDGRVMYRRPDRTDTPDMETST